MVNRNLLRDLVSDQDLNDAMQAAFSREDDAESDMDNWLREEKQNFESNKLVNGRVANIVGDKVIVDIGYKSEGEISIDEWREEGVDNPVFPKIGDEVQVLLDSVEDESGIIQLSFRKARRQREWESIILKHKEGDVVDGLVTKKIKGKVAKAKQQNTMLRINLFKFIANPGTTTSGRLISTKRLARHGGVVAGN